MAATQHVTASHSFTRATLGTPASLLLYVKCILTGYIVQTAVPFESYFNISRCIILIFVFCSKKYSRTWLLTKHTFPRRHPLVVKMPAVFAHADDLCPLEACPTP